MRISLGLPTHRVDLGDELVSAGAIATQSRVAEAAGFDAVFVTDHPFPGEDWLVHGGHHALDPLIALSFAAAATTRLRLHTNLYIAAYRNPFVSAKAVATLDVLSAGRVILGIGAGYLEPEFAALGVDFAQRNDLTDEAITAMKAAWTGEKVERSGRTFDAPGNIGSGTKDEAAFTLTLPTDRLGLKHGQLTGQATFRRSRVIDPTTGEPRAISGLHGADWEVHFTQGVPRWKATWGFDVLGQWGQTFYRFNEIDTDKLKTYLSLFAEYKPRADLTFKVELLNATRHGFDHYRQVFDGPRNQFPLALTDIRDLENGRFIRVSMIKSFG